MIGTFLATGGTLTATITSAEIQQSFRAPAARAGGAVLLPPEALDPYRGAPKVQTDMLANFSGEAVDYEDWERKAGVNIKQTAYKDLLDNPATPGDVISEARSKELYNMILSCVAGGHALNTIEKVRDSNNNVECGYKAWKYLKEWYLDPTQIDLMISHW